MIRQTEQKASISCQNYGGFRSGAKKHIHIFSVNKEQ